MFNNYSVSLNIGPDWNLEKYDFEGNETADVEGEAPIFLNASQKLFLIEFFCQRLGIVVLSIHLKKCFTCDYFL